MGSIDELSIAGWRLLVVCVLLILPGCGSETPPPADSEGDKAVNAGARPRYTREYVFIAERADNPTAALFEFQVTDTGEHLLRHTSGWLAYADTWDAFLEQSYATNRTSGVWRVLPHEELRVAAGGAAEIESIWYSRGEQNLELHLEDPLSVWNQGTDTRYRLLDATLELGAESTDGTMLEILRARRITSGAPSPDRQYDRLFLADSASLRIVMAEAMGSANPEERTFGWVLSDGDERTWEDAEVRWLNMRPLEEARRDIPLQWSFRIPDSGLIGEVTALGFDYTLGPEQAGRRAVEVRYTVEGWVEAGNVRRRVYGVVLHSQT
ncbi:MAG TPA: hypothetical protein VFI91_14755 [Longimicrobiaceae bacterium]|nr:hypothetical protein [Longimicrobiaceae bacterium]